MKNRPHTMSPIASKPDAPWSRNQHVSAFSPQVFLLTGQAPACYATDRGEVEASVPNTPIVFEDVEVVSATDVTLRCRVQGVVFTVGALQFLPGTTIHR